jgi:hypothetical protein
VLLTGGAGITGESVRTAELYDPKTGKFTATGSMSVDRAGQTATLLADGMVLISGGDGDTSAADTAELYDPKTGSFSSAGLMTSAREFQTATLLGDGQVLIAGGDDQSGNGLNTAELYQL